MHRTAERVVVPQEGALSGRWLGMLMRFRRPLLVLVVLGATASAVFGVGVVDRLSPAGWTPANAESTRADELLRGHFRAGNPDLVLVGTTGGTVDEPAAAGAGQRLTAWLRRDPRVEHLDSYWTTPSPLLRSRDGTAAVVSVRVHGNDREVGTAVDDLRRRAVTRDPVLDISAAGRSAALQDVQQQSQSDLVRAELVTVPAVLVILLWAFGNAVSALLSLAVGGIAVTGTLAVLRVLTEFAPVSMFAFNLTTALGFGLAVDYSLLILTRYRGELAAGRGVTDAIGESLRTAGRTVLFSALIVALCLAALLVFPLYFLRSLGCAGISVAVLSGLSSVVVLPISLALLGRRVHARPRWARWRSVTDGGRGPHGFFARIARTVMRRPARAAVPVVLVLLVLASPFLRVEFGLSDDRMLPRDAPVHRTTDMLRDDFGGAVTAGITVVLPGFAGHDGMLSEYAGRISALPGVAGVETATGSYSHGHKVAAPTPFSGQFATGSGSWLSAASTVDPYSAAGQRVVRDIRALPAPGPALVGGDAAALVDLKATLAADLPLAIGIVLAVALVLLFLFTGSVLLPLKAVVLNGLSLTTTFGAIVYVFQEGHLRWLLGDFLCTGTTDALIPVLLFCIAFAVSMDYEVFLLSRIVEEHRRTGDTAEAVAMGLEHTGRLFTAAAVLLTTVMLALATSGITLLKMLGVGLALAVVLDVSLVRIVLVPAIMRMAGRANWWCPRPLRRAQVTVE